MPSFIPVDYDPFAGAAEAAPNLFPAGRPLGGAAGAPNPVPYNPFAGASARSLIPVDHDPFADNPAAAPRLIPVDYNPFADAAAPSLIPVDHDPFADNPSAAPKLIPVDYDPFAAPEYDANAPGVNQQGNFDRRRISDSLPAPSNLFLLPSQTDSDNSASASPTPPVSNPFSPQDLPLSSPAGSSIIPASVELQLAVRDANANPLDLMPQMGPASLGSWDLPPFSTSASERQGGDPLASQSYSSISASPGGLNSDSTSGESNSDAAKLEQPSLVANTPGSRTRVVYDSAGRVAAIIRVGPAPPGDASPSAVSDSTADGLRPGAQYAQINNAITGNPAVDRTTDILLDVLQQTAAAMGDGSGPYFGTSVHTEFAKRVKRLDLPGIGMDGVEQSWNLGRVVPYASASSIRTDILLRDTKDPFQRPIAVYDLKTGYAFLQPPRVKRILDAVNTPGVWVIDLQYRTIRAINRPAPKQ
jgi:hypothetical protein